MDTNTTNHVSPPDTFSYTPGDVDRILGSLQGDATFLHLPPAIDVQRQFEAETKRMLSLNLHLTTMGEYLKHHRIPRGMRIHPQDSAYSYDLDYRAKYKLISNKYSLDLITLNMEFLQRDVDTSKQKIDTLEEILRSTLSSDDFEKFMSKQTTFLVKHRTEQETAKRHKWHRDATDYNNHHVYNWGQQSFNLKGTNKKSRDPRDTSRNTTNPTPSTSAPVTFLGAQDSPLNRPGEEATSTTGATRPRAPRSAKNKFQRYN